MDGTSRLGEGGHRSLSLVACFVFDVGLSRVVGRRISQSCSREEDTFRHASLMFASNAHTVVVIINPESLNKFFRFIRPTTRVRNISVRLFHYSMIQNHSCALCAGTKATLYTATSLPCLRSGARCHDRSSICGRCWYDHTGSHSTLPRIKHPGYHISCVTPHLRKTHFPVTWYKAEILNADSERRSTKQR